MPGESIIPNGFFTAGLKPEQAEELLQPFLERPQIRADLVCELAAVADQTHPGIREMRSAAERALDEWSSRQTDETLVRAGFLPHILLQDCARNQRIAALRTLAALLPDEAAFGAIWNLISCDSSMMADEAIHFLASNLPNHAAELLEAYRAPYAMVENNGVVYQNTLPKAGAFMILLEGIDRCDAALQAEIVRTVTFRYDGPVECEHKYARHPDCDVRNGVIKRLLQATYVTDDGDAAVSLRIREAIKTHFLDDLADALADHGSIYVEAVALMMNWAYDRRVVDAMAGYLETWGGTFQQENVTLSVIGNHANRDDAIVTERFVRALETLERKPMDADWDHASEGSRPPYTYIGEFSARNIREEIANWRRVKQPAGHP